MKLNSWKRDFLLSSILFCLYLSLSGNYDRDFFTDESDALAESNTSFVLPPDASISGTTTVCLNDMPQPLITFTGSSGVAPYTFTYTINGGANQTISTSGSNDSVSISVNTGTPGDYVYELVSVSDDNGDTETSSGTATISVTEPPSVSFTFNNNQCSGLPVNFSPIATGNGPFTFNWSFGDGTTSTLQNTFHVYDALGCGTSNFSAQLTVTDVNGCSTTVSEIVTVEQRPQLSFEDLDAGFGIPFDNCGNNTTDPEYNINVGNTSPSDSCVTSYDVDWGDGTSETNISFPISHTYTQLGSFNMVITGFGNSGCNTSETIIIRNSSNPTGAIETPGNTVNLCIPNTNLQFAIGSWGTNPPDTVYTVDYGDGTEQVFTQADMESSSFYNPTDPASSQNFPIPHTYTVSNCPEPNYTVSLNIATSCGESNLTAGPIIILSQPTVNFEFDDPGCVNTPVQFTNTTEGGFGPNCTENSAHLWDFGDGNTSTEQSPTHTYTAPGIYNVTLTEENFCGVAPPLTQTICIEAEPLASFTLDNIEGCTPFDVNVTNTTDVSQFCGAETYLWEVMYTPDFCGTSESWTFTNGTDETSINPSFQFDSAGTYNIRLTVTNSCGSSIADETIEVKQPPTATIDPIDNACGSISINPVANVDSCAPVSETVTYSWSFPGGTPATSNQLDPGTIDYTMVGDYTITFSVTNSCGTTVVTEDFSINEEPTITNTDLIQTICSGTESNEIIITSDNTSATFNWVSNNPAGLTGFIPSGTSNTIPAQTLINTTGSDITLIYTVTPDINGCSGPPVDFEIIVQSSPVLTTQPMSDQVCLNETPNDLSVTIQGSGTPSYQWYENTVNDNTSGTIIPGETSPTFTPPTDTLGVFYYYVVVTFGSGGCPETVSDVAEIIVNQPPSISDVSLLICSGNAFQYIPDGTSGDIVPANTAYTWTIPTINPPGTITGTSAQTTPVSIISQILTNTSANPSIVVYTVTPVSGNCSGPAFDVEVTVNPSITLASQVSNSSCFQSNSGSIDISISGGVPFSSGNPYNIQWSGPNGFVSTDEDINNLEPGSYTVNIEDDGNCPYTETFLITEPDELIFDSIDFDPGTISCFGANDGQIGIDVAGGTLPYTYSWTLNGAPFSSMEDLSNLGPGNYVVSVTDANGCGPITQDFTITEPQEFEVSLGSQTNVLCFGDSTGMITVIVTGGRPDYAYLWQGPNGFTSTEQNISDLAIGIYDLTVTDASNCTDTLQVEIIQNNEINIDVTVTQVECYGDDDGSIVINTISGGTAPYNVAWSNLGTGMQQTNLSPGTYTITITDAEDCQRAFEFIIDDVPLFSVNPVVEQMSCSGANDGSITLNFVGGVDPVNLVWDDGSPDGTERNNLAPGTYTVTITDATTCVIQESFTIFDIEPLELSANVTNALECDNPSSGSISLLIQGGSAPYSITWSNGETTEDINNISQGNYTAFVVDANGCEIEGSWDVDRFDPIQLDVTRDIDADCDSGVVNQSFEAIAFGGVPPFTFNWSSGTVTGPNNEFMTTSIAGLVVLEVEDSIGCRLEMTIDVEDISFNADVGFSVSSFAFLNFGIYSIQDPIQFTSEATGNFESILWDFGDGSFSTEENPVHTYASVGNYVVTLTVTYPFGCVYTSTITLTVEKGYELIVPDAFTPNNDRLNDFFKPELIGLNDLELRIYDTWGSLVYSEAGNSIRGWDGRVKDEFAENGNYYYTFSGKTFYGQEIKEQGAVVLIK